jgi:hypothetical protein
MISRLQEEDGDKEVDPDVDDDDDDEIDSAVEASDNEIWNKIYLAKKCSHEKIFTLGIFHFQRYVPYHCLTSYF